MSNTFVKSFYSSLQNNDASSWNNNKNCQETGSHEKIYIYVIITTIIIEKYL